MFGKTTLKVSGMSCAHCEKRVENAATAVSGVKSAKADSKKGELSFGGAHDQATLAAVRAAVIEAGYQAE